MSTLATIIVEDSVWAAVTVLALAIYSSACGPALARRREEAVRAAFAIPEVAHLLAQALGLRGVGARSLDTPAAQARTGTLGTPAPPVRSAGPVPFRGATASSPTSRVPALAHPGNRAWEHGGTPTRTGERRDSPAPVRVATRRWVA